MAHLSAQSSVPIAARPVDIDIGPVTLQGELDLPAGPSGLVIFAQPSGSSRHSPRNRRIAGSLQKAGFGTLLLDLLTVNEARADATDGALPFNIELLAGRLVSATAWAHSELGDRQRPIGYFAIDTGTAAALVAAAHEPSIVQAIVSVSGRPDLAGTELPNVSAPTLLLVGARDAALFELNRQAHGFLLAERELEIIPGAKHLYDEPGALQRVSGSAVTWFRAHLLPVASQT